MTRMRRLAAQLSIPQARFRDVLYGCPRGMNRNDHVGRIFCWTGPSVPDFIRCIVLV